MNCLLEKQPPFVTDSTTATTGIIDSLCCAPVYLLATHHKNRCISCKCINYYYQWGKSRGKLKSIKTETV